MTTPPGETPETVYRKQLRPVIIDVAAAINEQFPCADGFEEAQDGGRRRRWRMFGTLWCAVHIDSRAADVVLEPAQGRAYTTLVAGS